MKELTVLMPVYNTNVTWLSEAINSVLNQTYSDFDFLIIDDGSYVEDVWPCLQSYAQKDSRIKLVRNDQNLGLVASLNKGLNLIDSPWVARMDADDVCEPTRFEKQMQYLRNFPETAVLGTNGRYLETGRPYSRKRIPATHMEIAATLPFSCCFIHSALILNRAKVLELGGYPSLERAEDYALWLKFLFETNYSLANLPDYLIKIRKGNSVNLAYRKKVSDSGRRLRELISNYLNFKSIPALWDTDNQDVIEKAHSSDLIKEKILERFPNVPVALLEKELSRFELKNLKFINSSSFSCILRRLYLNIKKLGCELRIFLK